MFCENCGKEIKDENKFCPYCGASVQPEQNGEQPGAVGTAGTEE